jgi:hypothetical protein
VKSLSSYLADPYNRVPKETEHSNNLNLPTSKLINDIREDGLLCGVEARVLDYRSRGPASIPGAVRFFEK